MAESTIEVEVAFALPEQQIVLRLQAEQGISLEAAVNRSGILQRCPQIDWDGADVGIFGKLAKRDAVLNDGDRVEIYRPLIADPKAMRKKRAAEGKAMRRGGAANADKKSE
jgi:putative ubiquitin-RnfH superfamily antitoxin RatB of RatAB toxin-antitoxin module